MTATESESQTKLRVFSGIQPTGRKTLGNYSGGFRQYAETQEAGDAFFCIVDLHSITVEYDPAELKGSTLDLAAMLFATGLLEARDDVVHLLVGGVRPHHDQQLGCARHGHCGSV